MEKHRSPQKRHLKLVKADLFDDEEVQELILAAIGQDGASDEEIERVCRWAARVRMEETALSLALKGQIYLRVAEDGTMTAEARR